MIRLFTINDYDDVYQLWKRTPGLGLRSLDDSKDGIEKFLKRNPTSNFIAEEEGQIIGCVMSGHDGRRGFLYHMCVDEAYRNRSIGRKFVELVVEAMKAEKINKLALFCKADNDIGNRFWENIGWSIREDINYYSLDINEYNI